MPGRRTTAVIAAGAALLLPIAFVQAQSGSLLTPTMSMSELLSGKTIPLHLQMKDLASGKWRRVTAVDKTVTPVSAPTYTQGQTVRIDGESFLILYTLQSLGTKDTITAQVVFGGKPTPDAPLALTLLNLRNASALQSVVPFDLAKETVTQAELDRTIIKLRNNNVDGALREIGKGLLAYKQDYKKFPPMANSESAKAALKQYVPGNGDALFFHNFVSGKPFVPNSALSDKPTASIADPERVIALYDAVPAPDGTRAAVFADGHVERFAESKWSAVAHASGISAP